MKVKIVAQFNDAEGNFAHADLSKPVFADVREHIAEQWAKNGWCVILPAEKPPAEPIAAEKTDAKPKAKIERAVAGKRETAVGEAQK